MPSSPARGLARKNRINCYLTDDAWEHLLELQRQRQAKFGHPVALMLILEDTVRANAQMQCYWTASGYPGSEM